MASQLDFRPVFSLSSSRVLEHSPRETHHRHQHKVGFLAVVLEGGYTEVGDTGVWRVEAGDVIAHAPFEAHYNCVGTKGAKVLLLPLTGPFSHTLASVSDLDRVVHLASQSLVEAARYVIDSSRAKTQTVTDWVDLLASRLRSDPRFQINQWGEMNGIAPSEISRSFRKRYQCSAQQYRLAAKVRLAVQAITHSDSPLVAIAFDCGFADQAHMGRAIYAHTGFTPTGLRHEGIHRKVRANSIPRNSAPAIGS